MTPLDSLPPAVNKISASGHCLILQTQTLTQSGHSLLPNGGVYIVVWSNWINVQVKKCKHTCMCTFHLKCSPFLSLHLTSHCISNQWSSTYDAQVKSIFSWRSETFFLLSWEWSSQTRSSICLLLIVSTQYEELNRQLYDVEKSVTNGN